MKWYGFVEIKDGGRQLFFDEVVIEANSKKEAKRGFNYWLVSKALETDNIDGEEHAEFMDFELAPKRAKNLKPRKVEEIISEALEKLSSIKELSEEEESIYEEYPELEVQVSGIDYTGIRGE